jgi:DNA-binding protein HU-beta
MDRISKSDLIKAVAAAQGTTQTTVESIINEVLNFIKNAATAGNAVHLGNGFGVFTSKQTKAMTKSHPLTKAPIDVPAKRVIKFNASAALKSAVNQGK